MLKKKIRDEFLESSDEQKQTRSKKEGTRPLQELERVENLDQLADFPAIVIPNKVAFIIKGKTCIIDESFAQEFLALAEPVEKSNEHLWMSTFSPTEFFTKNQCKKYPVKINGAEQNYEEMNVLSGVSTIKIFGRELIYIGDSQAWQEYLQQSESND